MITSTLEQNKRIVIQVRHADNHIAASFEFEFSDHRDIHDLLKMYITWALAKHAIMQCENLEFPLHLNGVEFQQGKK